MADQAIKKASSATTEATANKDQSQASTTTLQASTPQASTPQASTITEEPARASAASPAQLHPAQLHPSPSQTPTGTIVAVELLAPHPSEQAFIQISPEFATLTEDDNIHINVDVLESVTTVLGSLPRIRALRPEIEDQLPRFNIARFDKLETYTLALSHAHTWFRAALIPKAEVTARAAKLEEVREQLLFDVQGLASHGLLDGSPAKGCKTIPGHRGLASDVLTLVKVVKDNWAQVQGKTPQDATTLNAAASAALELLAAIGLRDQGAVTADEPGSARRKAYTLFRRAYDDAHKAIAYLRSKEEAEELAPSLYSGRGGRRSAENTVPQPPAVNTPPVPDANTSPATPLAEATPAVSSVVNSPATSAAISPAAAAFAIDNRAGLPITHPLKD